MSASPERAAADARIGELTARELARFEATTPASRRLAARAGGHLAGAVPSSFQRVEPWPVHLVEGAGARVLDADGTERVDFHNGFGATVAGHANPAIAAAVARRSRAGTQFGAPGEDAIAVAAELARRWRLPLWRFANSGTEAAGDAIRIARAATGRAATVTIAGGYHGVGVAEDAPAVEFNDAAALERRLAEMAAAGSPAACLILEPAMMLGCLLPEPGYLDEVAAIVRAAGALLVFDGAKTGLAIAAGGAVEAYGVVPDLVVLAKALGGGLPVAAVGGTEAVMAGVASGSVVQAGTFNGNPLAMAAARACLEEVLRPAAYESLNAAGERLRDGLERIEVMATSGAAVSGPPSRRKGPDAAALRSAATRRDAEVPPLRALGRGARGGFARAVATPRTAAELLAARPPRLERLLWLYGLNRGVYLTPARPQNWTISVAHGPEEVDAYVAVVAEFSEELAASTQSGSGSAS